MHSSPTRNDRTDRKYRATVAGRLLVCGLLACLAGCGADGVELAPATGIVTLDGQPVEGAGVTFQPVAGGPVASGTTDRQGRFQLRTMNELGAPIGEHIVVISKTQMDLPRLADGKVDENKLREIPDIEETNLLPARYASRATSELRAVVGDAGERVTFSLTSDETVAMPGSEEEATEEGSAVDEGSPAESEVREESPSAAGESDAPDKSPPN